MMAGAAWREEREWERTAWLAAMVMNVSGKVVRRSVTPNELLGREEPFAVRDPHVSFEGLWGEIERLRSEGKMTEG